MDTLIPPPRSSRRAMGPPLDLSVTSPKLRLLVQLVIPAAILLIIAVGMITGYLEKWLWMGQLKYVGIFWKLFSVQWTMYAISFAGVFVFVWFNLRHALVVGEVPGGPVDDLARSLIAAGASRITFHVDAATHVDRTLALIKSEGALAGLAFNPATPLGVLEWVIDKVDLVLVMSVNPGFGGQQFIHSTLRKLDAVRQIIDRSGRDVRLQVDDGVKIGNIAEIAHAGADVFVAGSGIFGAPDYADAIKAMRTELVGATWVPFSGRPHIEPSRNRGAS